MTIRVTSQIVKANPNDTYKIIDGVIVDVV